MPRYRCCFMGDDGEVIGVEMFNAVDESVARRRAHELIARHDYPAIEVWDHSEMLYRVEKKAPEPSTTRSTSRGRGTKSR